jgi:hypothetical protein
MHRFKIPLRVTLFVAIIVVLSVLFVDFIHGRIQEIEHTQAVRSRMQAQINKSIHGWYQAQIRDTRLFSRCGITAYAATMLDVDGNEFTLYYNIDTGAPVRQDLLNGCSVNVTDSAAVRDAGKIAGV